MSVFYVCQGGDGSDPTSGVAADAWSADLASQASHWASIKTAGKIGPGDTLYFMSDGGTITGTMGSTTGTIAIGASGTAGAVITLTGDGSAVISGEGSTATVGERFCIYASSKNYIAIDNLELAYGYNSVISVGGSGGCHHWTLTNCEVHHCTPKATYATLLRGWGTYWTIAHNDFHDNEDSHILYFYANTDSTPSSDIIIEYNTFENGYNNGIQFNGEDQFFSNIVIRYNHIKNNGDDGILLCTTDGAEIYGNIFENTASACWEMICLGDDSVGTAKVKDTKIWHNTFYGLCEAALFLHGYYVTGVACVADCSNNIFYPTDGATGGTPNYYYYDGTNTPALITASDYNLFYSAGEARWHLEDDTTKATLALWQAATTYDDNSVEADPEFTDAGGSDFTLGATSPAKTAGIVGSCLYGLAPSVTLADFGRGGSVTLAPYGANPSMGAYAYGLETNERWVLVYG